MVQAIFTDIYPYKTTKRPDHDHDHGCLLTATLSIVIVELAGMAIVAL